MQRVSKGKWIDQGDGIQQFFLAARPLDNTHESEAIQHYSPSLSFIKHKQPSSPPPGSRSTLAPSNGLLSPPPSNKKKRPKWSVGGASLPESEVRDFYHDYKLIVRDAKGHKIPRVAFRVYNAKTQGHNSPNSIRAGLFKDHDATITPPLLGQALRDALLNHLTPLPQRTPFISTFDNFLPCLHRAICSSEPAYIAIVDMARVAQDSRARFPDVDQVIYSARCMIRRYGFHLRHHYNGGPEWLVHGAISGDAIIRTISVAELHQLADTGQIPRLTHVLAYISRRPHAYALLANLSFALPKVGWKTGQLVGQVLESLQIPGQYKVLIARKILHAVAFRGTGRSRGRAYIRGVLGIAATEEDLDIDLMDQFVQSDDNHDESDGDAMYGDKCKNKRRASSEISNITSQSCDTHDENEDENGSLDGPELSEMEDDEQALIDMQLHTELLQYLRSQPPATWREMIHVAISHQDQAIQHIQHDPSHGHQRGKVKKFPEVIDLTADSDEEENNDDDNDILDAAAPSRVQLHNKVRHINEKESKADEVVIIAEARRTLRSLPIRSLSASVSASTRSPVGLRGLKRLEADVREAEGSRTAEPEIMEVLRLD